MSTHILRNSWLDFERMILDPINASTIQRQEMRRAFYAGAQVVMATNERIGQDYMPEDRGVEIMAGLYEELRVYRRTVGTWAEGLIS